MNSCYATKNGIQKTYKMLIQANSIKRETEKKNGSIFDGAHKQPKHFGCLKVALLHLTEEKKSIKDEDWCKHRE